MSTPTPRQPPRPTPERSRTGPQQHIAALRTGLLGGRGPGASPTELEAHQHQRVVFGGLPVTAARERESLNTAEARGDALDEAQLHADRRLAHLAGKPPPVPPPHRGTDAALALALGVLLGFAAARLRGRGHR